MCVEGRAEKRAPHSPSLRKVPRPPYSSIAMNSPVIVQNDGSPARSLSQPPWIWGASNFAWVVLETGAAANLACPRRFGSRNSISENGVSRVSIYPAYARFEVGGGRLGGVRFAAGTPVGIAA